MDYLDKYEEKAELLKVLGHPVRLCIVAGLMENSCNVSRIQECLSLPQSTVSQHLSALKARGVIKGERRGTEICYSVVSEAAKQVIRALLDEDSKRKE